MKIYFETELKELPPYCIPQDCPFHTMCDTSEIIDKNRGDGCRLKSKQNILDELTVKDFEHDPNKIDAQINGLHMMAEMLETRKNRKKVKII